MLKSSIPIEPNRAAHSCRYRGAAAPSAGDHDSQIMKMTMTDILATAEDHIDLRMIR